MDLLASVELRPPKAGRMTLETAYSYNVTLWTQDTDFEGIDGVHYVEKR